MWCLPNKLHVEGCAEWHVRDLRFVCGKGKVGRRVNSSRLRWVGDLMLGWDVGNLLSEWKATEDADGRALPAP